MQKAKSLSSSKRASFWARALAIIIDGLLLGVLAQIIQYIVLLIFPLPSGSSGGPFGFFLVMIINLIFLPLFYYIPLMKQRGQTIGKIFMKIKVINADNTPNLKVSTIVLREFLGKFISSLVLMVGYIIYLFGKETWHDRIASTRVITLE